jgi:hypothetical protein
MSDPTKIRGIAASTRKPNAAYKPTWGRIFRKTAGQPSAAEDVNDLRPLRGALSRVIDILLASAQSPIMGSWRSPLSEERRNSNDESNFDHNAVLD